MDNLAEGNEKNLEGQPDEKVVMQIILTKTGELKVGGMIHDKIAALGMLELAKNTLIKFWEASEVKIHKPNGIMDFVRNGKKS